MKILHLYYDIMNLYGDYANITALRKIAEHSGEEVAVDKLSIGDDADLSAYDFIYIGSGTEKNQKVVLEDIRRYKDVLTACIDAGKVILMTGNSFEMLGQSITDAYGEAYEGLGLFGFTTAEQNKTRLTNDAVYECSFLDSPLVGFVNKCSGITGIDEPMFTVRLGLGNRGGDTGEGMRKNNLFCTHLTGPVLVKNPHLLRYMCSLITGRDADDGCLVYEKKGYAVTLRELNKRIEDNK